MVHSNECMHYSNAYEDIVWLIQFVKVQYSAYIVIFNNYCIIIITTMCCTA